MASRILDSFADMRTLAVIVALLVFVGTARAQAPGSPPPPPTYPPPYQYQPAVSYPAPLTQEEHELLLQGEISDGAHIGGGLAALFIGYGTGQAIQGRWSDTGWIFTVGEGASTAALIYGVLELLDDCVDNLGRERDCDNSNAGAAIAVGLIGVTVFRTWGTIDAFAGPSSHNRRVRELKYRMGIPVRVGWKPYITKTRDEGAVAGLSLSF